ncbi:hypothetical protein RFI_03261, partial [Reticulomyxa filosa]
DNDNDNNDADDDDTVVDDGNDNVSLAPTEEISQNMCEQEKLEMEEILHIVRSVIQDEQALHEGSIMKKQKSLGNTNNNIENNHNSNNNSNNNNHNNNNNNSNNNNNNNNNNDDEKFKQSKQQWINMCVHLLHTLQNTLEHTCIIELKHLNTFPQPIQISKVRLKKCLFCHEHVECGNMNDAYLSIPHKKECQLNQVFQDLLQLLPATLTQTVFLPFDRPSSFQNLDKNNGAKVHSDTDTEEIPTQEKNLKIAAQGLMALSQNSILSQELNVVNTNSSNIYGLPTVDANNSHIHGLESLLLHDWPLQNYRSAVRGGGGLFDSFEQDKTHEQTEKEATKPETDTPFISAAHTVSIDPGVDSTFS